MTIIACCCTRGNTLNCCCGIALPETLYLTMAVTGACGPCFNVVDRPLHINPDVVDYADFRRCNSVNPSGPGLNYGRFTPLPFPIPTPVPYLWGCVTSVQFVCTSNDTDTASETRLIFDTHHTPVGGIDGVSSFALLMTILSCNPFHAIATARFPTGSLTFNEADFLDKRPSAICGVAGTSTFSAEIHA